MLCHFCYAYNRHPRLTKEHLVSRPIAAAYGIDRAGYFGRIGNSRDASATRSLESLAVKFVCDTVSTMSVRPYSESRATAMSWPPSRATPSTPVPS